MAKFERFEDIKAWQKARALNHDLWPFFQRLNENRLWELRNQMLRSAGSMMDNIVEGFERESNREFLTFLGYAKASAGELRSQLYRSFDFEQLSEVEFQQYSSRAEEVSRMIGGLMTYLKDSERRGYRLSEPVNSYGDSSPTGLPDEFLQNQRERTDESEQEEGC